MYDFLHHRHHRFDALFEMLTGHGSAPLPRNAHLLRDVGLPERIVPSKLSRIMLMTLTHRTRR